MKHKSALIWAGLDRSAAQICPGGYTEAGIDKWPENIYYQYSYESQKIARNTIY